MKQAFTLVETILYIGIVATVLVAVSTLGWTVVNSGVKSRTQEEVAGTARFVAERITYEIRRASGISNVSAGSITLTNFAPDTNTVIDLSGGKVRINKNGGGAVNLNSDDTVVSVLSFTNYTSVDNKTKNIGFTITVNSAYAGGSQLFESTTTIRSSAEVRSN